MAKITLLKRYKSALCLSLLFLTGSSLAERTRVLSLLPVILQAGVLPTSVENPGNIQRVEPFLKELKKLFPLVVRQSMRFQVLGDGLIAGLWQQVAGRKELREKYELDVFLHLNVVVFPDKLFLITRLLDSDLGIELQESLVHPWGTAADLTPEKAHEVLRQVLFAMTNQLPADIYISSIQGSFITLTGGLSQGLQVGEKIELTRSWPIERHVATGAWSEFKVIPIGSARIIETTANVSIARLEALEVEGQIQIGDGAKVPELASRNYFQKPAKIQTAAGEQSGIVIHK